MEFYINKFQLYEECLDDVLNSHVGSIKKWNLTYKLQRNLKEAHLDYIGEEYHQDLNKFFSLEIERINKKQHFKYYANEFKDRIRKHIFPSSIRQVTQKYFSKKFD